MMQMHSMRNVRRTKSLKGGFLAIAIDESGKRYVEPALQKARIDRVGLSRTLNDPPTQGSSSAIGQLRDGKPYEFAFSTWPTEDGARSAILETTLRNVWLFEWQYLKGRQSVAGPWLYEARIWGLRRDRAKLEAIGLTGMVAFNNGRFQTWDQWEAKWEERRIRGMEAPPTPITTIRVPAQPSGR